MKKFIENLSKKEEIIVPKIFFVQNNERIFLFFFEGMGFKKFWIFFIHLVLIGSLVHSIKTLSFRQKLMRTINHILKNPEYLTRLDNEFCNVLLSNFFEKANLLSFHCLNNLYWIDGLYSSFYLKENFVNFCADGSVIFLPAKKLKSYLRFIGANQTAWIDSKKNVDEKIKDIEPLKWFSFLERTSFLNEKYLNEYFFSSLEKELNSCEISFLDKFFLTPNDVIKKIAIHREFLSLLGINIDHYQNMINEIANYGYLFLDGDIGVIGEILALGSKGDRVKLSSLDDIAFFFEGKFVQEAKIFRARFNKLLSLQNDYFCTAKPLLEKLFNLNLISEAFLKEFYSYLHETVFLYLKMQKESEKNLKRFNEASKTTLKIKVIPSKSFL